MKPPHADPDVLLGSDGHVYVNAASLRLADRVGRRVIRCVALTPREQEELRRGVGSLAPDLLVGLTAKRGGLAMMPELRTSLRALAWNVTERRHSQQRWIEAIALEADMAPRRWARIEAGEGNPTLTTLVKVGVALGVALDDLFAPRPALTYALQHHGRRWDSSTALYGLSSLCWHELDRRLRTMRRSPPTTIRPLDPGAQVPLLRRRAGSTRHRNAPPGSRPAGA